MDNPKPNVTLMMGIPGCGKTTYVLENFRNTHVRLNLDTIKSREKERRIFAACLDSGVNVVIDNTNMSRKERARFVPLARLFGYEIRVIHIRDTFERCAPRVLERSKTTNREPIPDKGILDSFVRYEPVVMDEEGIDIYTELENYLGN